MRETLRDPGRLVHILDAATKIINETPNHTLESIKADPLVFYGLVKLVEIIGEASYKLSREFKSTHPQLPWQQIEGMRHVLVHGYYTVSPEMLWDTITYDIPQIIPIISEFIKELDNVKQS